MTVKRSDAALGIEPGAVIQMVGWDDDCDERLRASVTTAAGAEPVDEDYDDVVDTVLLWWRADDGDLIDGLLDAIAMLAEGGSIWLVTPKPGRDGFIEPQEISDAAPTAGLRLTGTISAAADWNAAKLVPRSGNGKH